MSQNAFNGKYFQTCYNDIRSSQGWFGKVCLLGLISFIPVFGQMTTYGYSYEWAHKAAWGLDEPMPRKIYGRPNSKMLRWGWFALVIAVVISIIPGFISGIGNAMQGAGAVTGYYTGAGRYMMMNPGNAMVSGFGGLVSLIGFVLSLFACIIIWVAIIRMTMYDRLSTGFQLGKIWAMMKRDFGGLMRIFGMMLIFQIIGGVIIFMIVMGILVAVLGAAFGPMLMMLDGGMYTDSSVAMYILSVVMMMLPVFLVFAYIALCFEVFVQLLVARAVGYWTRQFNVAEWGTKDDPLPTANTAQSAAQPQPPVSPQPAPPVGEPVIVDEVVETKVTDAQGDVVADEVEEVEVTLESEDASEEK